MGTVAQLVFPETKGGVRGEWGSHDQATENTLLCV